MTQEELIAKIKEWVLRRKYIHHNMYKSRNDDEKISLIARTLELEDAEFIYFLDTLLVEKTNNLIEKFLSQLPSSDMEDYEKCQSDMMCLKASGKAFHYLATCGNDFERGNKYTQKKRKRKK